MKNSLKKFTYLTLISSLFVASNINALEKDETVYTKLNADGSIKNTTVTEHLIGLKNEKSDVTDLKNILNINGDEKITQSNYDLMFDTDKNELFYKGSTTKEIPITTSISYKLDGKIKTLKQMLGKKGKVEISINYKNTSCETISVNGTKTKMCTPFVVTMGTIISATENTNIEVTNGKVISNGTNNMVVAIASPGLDSSLAIPELSKLNNITITYETTNFKLNTMYTAMTSKLIDNDDLKVFDKLDSLYSQVNTLASSSKQLSEGSKTLLTGISALKDGVSQAVTGVTKLYDGVNLIKSNIDSTIKALETNKTNAIDEQTLTAIKTQSETSATLTLEQQNAISTQAIEIVKNSDTYKQLENSYNSYFALSTQAKQEANSYRQAGDEQTALKYDEKTKEATQAATTYKTMMELMSQTASTTAIETAKTTAVATAGKVAYNVAFQVANQAKESATTSSLTQLKTLSTGLGQLTEGINTLKIGTNDLYNGNARLEEGAKTLSEGMNKFDNEGIQKISNLVNGTVKTTESRLKALVKLGNKYDTFTMKNENTTSSTKFITIVEEQSK